MNTVKWIKIEELKKNWQKAPNKEYIFRTSLGNIYWDSVVNLTLLTDMLAIDISWRPFYEGINYKTRVSQDNFTHFMVYPEFQE